MSHFVLSRSHVLRLLALSILALVACPAGLFAALGDYGVMWSFQVPDEGGGDAINFQHGGGYANGLTYISSWHHSNTWPPTTSGGRGFFAGGVDHWGQLSPNFVFMHPQSPPNAIAQGGQAYGFGIHVKDVGSGQTNIALSGMMQNAGDWQHGIPGSTLSGVTSMSLVRWNDVENAGGPTESFRAQPVYSDAAQTDPLNLGWSYANYMDDAGNTYIAGGVTENIFHDGNTYTHANPGTASATRDPFILKYNAAGTNVGGVITHFDYDGGIGDHTNDAQQLTTAMTVDESTGHIYIAGRNQGDIDGDGFSGGTYDAYVARYDSSFNLDWVVELETPGYDLPNGLKLDGSGNLYVGLEYNDAAALAKLNTADGSTAWVTPVGTDGRGFEPYIDGDGDIWLPGWSLDDLADAEGNTVDGADNILVEFDPNSGAVKTVHQFGADPSLANPADPAGLFDAAQYLELQQDGEIMFISGYLQGEWPDFSRSDIGAGVSHNDDAAAALKYTIGDLTDDGLVNWDDMLDVVNALDGGPLPGDTTYDFNGDGDSTSDDIDYFMEKIFESEFGDFDWDGVVEYGPDDPTSDEYLLAGWEPGDDPIPITDPNWRGFSGPDTPDEIDLEEWLYLFGTSTAVPEPSTLIQFVLIGLGVAAGFVAYRRKRSRSVQ